jgi:hypothetical protein
MKTETIEKIFNFLEEKEGKKIPERWNIVEKFENHIKKTPYSHDAYLMKFRKTIETEGVNEVFFFYYNNDAFNINGFELDTNNCNIKFCSQEDYNMLRDLFVNKNVYMQDDLLKILNQDVVIDTEMYKQLNSMLENGETSNVKIAMEIMANSDYEKSAPYLLLLFMNHGYRIWDSGFRNHVNFLFCFFICRCYYSIFVVLHSKATNCCCC